MRRLRDPQGGCPWDREQTFASIAPYTIEEAYEVADAIARGSSGDIESELGDLLFQVVFHARMGEERGWFDFASVADAISEKLTARHPHVFADAKIGSADEQNRAWEEHKARERAARGRSSAERTRRCAAGAAGAGARRQARQARRARGFDWPDASGVRAKIDEELREVDAGAGRAARRRSRRPAVRRGQLVASSRRGPGGSAALGPTPNSRRAFAPWKRWRANVRCVSIRSDAAAWDALWNEVKTREKAARQHVQ